MIGMSFASFLVLLAIGLASAACVHLLARYRVLKGADGFFMTWIFGWIGGWLGSPVLGHWAGHVGGVYIVPALIFAFSFSFLITALFKAGGAAVAQSRQQVGTGQQTTATQFEMRKAG